MSPVGSSQGLGRRAIVRLVMAVAHTRVANTGVGREHATEAGAKGVGPISAHVEITRVVNTRIRSRRDMLGQEDRLGRTVVDLAKPRPAIHVQSRLAVAEAMERADTVVVPTVNTDRVDVVRPGKDTVRCGMDQSTLRIIGGAEKRGDLISAQQTIPSPGTVIGFRRVIEPRSDLLLLEVGHHQVEEVEPIRTAAVTPAVRIPVSTPGVGSVGRMPNGGWQYTLGIGEHLCAQSQLFEVIRTLGAACRFAC